MTSSRRPQHDRPSSGEISSLANTNCSKGHLHPSWNTTGVLRIAKCESVCGFCQKETKTAANLRKHVAIHIKNEGLNLAIAEGSSGRGRLEMPPAQPQLQGRNRSSSSQLSTRTDDSEPMDAETSYQRTFGHQTADSFSPSAVLMSMASHSQPHPSYTLSTSASPSPYPSYPTSHAASYTPSPFRGAVSSGTGSTSTAAPLARAHSHSPDPFRALREHNIGTKYAWTVIPAAEGFQILDLCKQLSVARGGDGAAVPCYNRETIFDEEWQAHMKDVHGVFLLWPQTWMRRIEVLDLDAFGGDIGACNDVIMDV
ncbi:hypothetical protein LZ554_003523 [Drepanopeziza brunnea f. sp. 'monogermtubi']|nr:hypothetical protein LZ554_003523 [Drepanopeziza brunnea f. sp. 'monogermtubi']